MFDECPAVIVHTMAFINQELTQVSGRHVGGDLHHFTHAVLAENLHNLRKGHTAPRSAWTGFAEVSQASAQSALKKSG